jgi:hypothetical protein
VLVDGDTSGRVAQAAKLVEWPVQLITFGDLAIDGATTVQQLLDDDGSGELEHHNSCCLLLFPRPLQVRSCLIFRIRKEILKVDRVPLLTMFPRVRDYPDQKPIHMNF